MAAPSLPAEPYLVLTPADLSDIHAHPTPTEFATAIIGRCLETGAEAVLFDAGALPPAFFDLRSGLAGELLQKLANYRLRMAAVVPELADATARSASFRDFARETNAGRLCRLFAARDQAERWLRIHGHDAIAGRCFGTGRRSRWRVLPLCW